ncbi:MAG: ABC transporter substrate-binding protein [Xanthobacteraceae bacterium]|nr:ABC transporter substrate-binding protein [Xanthobacteraceae bacterium]GIK97770.1 MAG: branched-chain amino acid ABC transporter substrate-binding protein [Alphaproteobacteria bacterium]
MRRGFALACVLFASLAGSAGAQEISVGVTMGATGPGASLGIHYKNAFQLFPKTLGGQPVKYIILEDATDPANAAKNARKLIAEDKVDVVMGSVSVPSTTQVAQIATEAKTPMIALSPVALPPDKLEWVFVVPQPVALMMGAVVDHMKTKGVKTVGYVGFSDSWGDLVLKALEQHAGPAGIKVVTNERYARADTSVTGQVIKVLAANPDAVVVGGSGTGGALPHIGLVERNYKKQIYHNHGTVNREYIKVGGKAVEGAIAPTGPLLVPEDLPAGNPIKKVAADFIARYEAAFGAGSRNAFAGYSYDGYLLLEAAVPAALKKAKPGTPEFRAALRDALESVKEVVGTHGVYTMSPKDHTGLDSRARVLVHVDKGAWRLLP